MHAALLADVWTLRGLASKGTSSVAWVLQGQAPAARKGAAITGDRGLHYDPCILSIEASQLLDIESVHKGIRILMAMSCWMPRRITLCLVV